MRHLKILGLSLASLAAVVVTAAPAAAQYDRHRPEHRQDYRHGGDRHHRDVRRSHHRPREVCRKERRHGHWTRVCHRVWR